MNIRDMFIADHLTYGEIAEWEPNSNQLIGFLHADQLAAWNRLRKELGVPLTVNSGWRSAWMNGKVGGSPISQHLIGRAFDLWCLAVDLSALKQIPLFIQCGFRGIGRGNGWVHLDTRLQEPTFFRYEGKETLPDDEAKNVWLSSIERIL